jgi:hypothetical protein
MEAMIQILTPQPEFEFDDFGRLTGRGVIEP